ncbi:MAG: UDPglucose 6-dehydrogenase [Frankiales bacterium]|nr:UDPglucose 6-dehydrogenase [Frankiales bacterium]
MARIFIIGSGVVGTATGTGFARAGHQVTFVDVLDSRIEQLTEGGFNAQKGIELDDQPAFVFLTLPTPHNGRAYDLSIFDTGVTDVGRALAESEAVHTVVVRSTVPPGTTEGRVLSALERSSGKTVGQGFALASNPEFLRAASAAEDFRWPWMTVVASRSKRTQERLTELLSPFGGDMRVFDNPATAEFIKCAHNIYNATKISFWNEMWLVARELNLDHDAISATVAQSAEGSFNREYGIRGGAPYGGVCLPKDTNGFLGFAKTIGVEMPLLDAVVTVNERLAGLTDTELDAMLDKLSAPADIDLTSEAPKQRTSSSARGSVGASDGAVGG